jgi:hypothetical protein
LLGELSVEGGSQTLVWSDEALGVRRQMSERRGDLKDLVADTPDDAMFSWQLCLDASSITDILHLPPRPRQCPYLVYFQGVSCDAFPTPQGCELLETLLDDAPRQRDGILFVSFDLRDPWLLDDEHAVPHGVTMAPPEFLSQPADNLGWGIDDLPGDPKYFLTFQGKRSKWRVMSSTVRDDLQEYWVDIQKSRPDIVINVFDHDHDYTENDSAVYLELMMNATFAIVPHGDGRWNYRFSEVIGACAIPVIMADGLTLPFAELIDWPEASVVIPESFASSPERVLQVLESFSSHATQQMRLKVCEINRKYFSTPEKRWKALLETARLKVAVSNRLD